MWRFYKTYIVLIILLVLCGCRHLGPYVYKTYAPVKETLLFHEDNRCVYTYYDIIENKKIVDTCSWRLTKGNAIILYKEKTCVASSLNDSVEMATLNFEYEICPKWYNIEKWEFRKYAAYKSPIYQDIFVEIPLNATQEQHDRIIKGRHLTFADKYGQYRITSDTIHHLGSFIVWQRKLTKRCPSFLFACNKQMPKETKKLPHDFKKTICSFVTDSYEYLNYKINYERKVDFDKDTIIGKQFSFIGEERKKESIRFVNDTICTHSFSVRADMSSPFTSSLSDTCHYSAKNNLIVIDFDKDKPCDTLTYSNGILFYSKVYKDEENEKYTHIVKPFIDETRSCANKKDSINMIMSTYFNVYVPLNLYK